MRILNQLEYFPLKIQTRTSQKSTIAPPPTTAKEIGSTVEQYRPAG